MLFPVPVGIGTESISAMSTTSLLVNVPAT